MAITLQEYRSKYPQYNDLSDQQLADSLHKKYYSDIPKESFYSNIGHRQSESVPEDSESKGLTGVLSDLISKGYETISNLPSAIAQAPGEAFGAINQITNEPKRALQNLGAGFGELGHDVLSAPGAVRDYLIKKDLISKESPNLRLPESILPKDFNYAESVGLQDNKPGDTLLRGAPEAAALLPAGDLKILNSVSNPLNKLLEESALTRKLSSRPLRGVSREVEKRGISLPPGSNAHLIEESREYLPNTTRLGEIINKATEGNYKSLFKIQSDLGEEARSLRRKGEKVKASHADDLRQKILDGIKNSLSEVGHEDLAKEITRGQKIYKRHKTVIKPLEKILGVGAAAYIPGIKLYDAFKNR